MQVQKLKPGYKLVKSLFGKYEEIPHDWPSKNLEEVGLIKGRIGWRGYTQNDFVKKGKGAISLGGTNIKNNSLDLTNLTYVSWNKYDESPEIHVHINDILIQKTGSIGGIAIIDRDIGKATINPNVSVIKKIKIEPNFLSYFLTSSYIQRQIQRFKTATSVPLLTQEQIRSLIIFLPTKIEQQKIASMLSNVDSLIQQTEEIIKQTNWMQKGLKQKLLTKGIGNTKFKKLKWLFGKEIEIPLKWKVVNCNEVSSKILDGEHISPEFSKSGIPYISSKHVKSIISFKNSKYVNSETYKKLIKRCFPEFDDLLITVKGTVGFCKRIDIKDKFCMDRNVGLIKPLHDLLDPVFFENFMKFEFVQKQIISFIDSTVIPSLYLNRIKKIRILLPPKQEQEKIGSILLEIDKRIKQYEENKVQFEILKKGLMQKLLTGEIRV